MTPPLCDVFEPISAPVLRGAPPKGKAKIDGLPVRDSRCLGGEHSAEIERLLMSLEREARCARFGHACSDTSITAHVTSALSNATRVIGIFVDHELRGLLEIYAGDVSTPVEVAVVVEQGWRRRGLGWALTQDAMRWAAEAKAGPLRLIFSRHNWPMRHLCAKASARFDLILDEICADIIPEKRACSDQRLFAEDRLEMSHADFAA